MFENKISPRLFKKDEILLNEGELCSSIVYIIKGAAYQFQLSKWLGYYGLLIVVVTAAALLLKFNFTSVFGFGLFIFSLVSWKIIAAILLIISSKKIQVYE